MNRLRITEFGEQHDLSAQFHSPECITSFLSFFQLRVATIREKCARLGVVAVSVVLARVLTRRPLSAVS